MQYAIIYYEYKAGEKVIKNRFHGEFDALSDDALIGAWLQGYGGSLPAPEGRLILMRFATEKECMRYYHHEIPDHGWRKKP